MIKAFLNILRIPELRNKLMFTIGALMLYRLGFQIPLPGINTESLKAAAKVASEKGAGLAEYMSLFSGGSLSQSSIFGLGIMPYISAAIIFQLLGTVVPSLRKMQEEGPAGYQKIQEYTRYATVGLCLVQAIMMLTHFSNSASAGASIVYPQMQGTALFWISGVIGLSAGTIFLMWLGEQIDKYGLGNGVSLIITGGILARMPWAITQIVNDFDITGNGRYGISTAVLLVVVFIVVIAGAVIITQGQRRIPIQQAKHTRGRRVFGGQKTFLPLRVNHGGVMPIIFASSLMMFPGQITKWAAGYFNNTPSWHTISGWFDPTSLTYILVYIMMIFFFSFFWTTVQFNPEKVSKQLRDSGSFVPGLRPGPRTADYLENVMGRITYAGAGFLALIAIVPTIVMKTTDIPYSVSAFLGGTGLLITVSVMLDFVQRIEAGLLMRNYDGFLGEGQKIRS